MLSVIIPVYNVQKYLARCVESVLGQTHRDLEVILVDDGSTDSCGTLCDQYATQDQRVKVIHKSNGGLSSARNAGLDVMTGEYVTFVDADDFIHRDFAIKLLQAIGLDAQIAVGRWQECDEGETPIEADVIWGDVISFTRDEAIDEIYYQRRLTHSACSRIFEASLFDDLRFPKGKLYEDLAISYNLLKKVNKVVYIDNGPPLYYYMHRAGSIINTMKLERTHVLDHLEKIEREISDEAPQHLPAVRSRHMSACFNMLRLMPASDPLWQPTKERCWQYIKKMRLSCLKDRNVRAKNKAACLLSYLGLDFLMAVINNGHKISNTM
jgi:glycosyltransferase involved in cell wall biosynthesis